MKKFKHLIFFVALLLWQFNGFGQNINKTNLTDSFYSSGKIYVVVCCVFIILIALFYILLRIDKKLNRLEKELKD